MRLSSAHVQYMSGSYLQTCTPVGTPVVHPSVTLSSDVSFSCCVASRRCCRRCGEVLVMLVVLGVFGTLIS